MKKMSTFVSEVSEWLKIAYSYPGLSITVTLVTLFFGLVACGFDQPRTVIPLLILVFIGVFLLWGSLKMRRSLIEEPLTGAGSAGGTAIAQLIIAFVGWLGVVFLMNASVVLVRLLQR